MTGPPTEPPPGTTTYMATIRGTWNPGSIPPLTAEQYSAAQRAASAETHRLLGIVDNILDFHVVGTKDPADGRVYRTRWRVEGYGSGPGLRMGATGPHPSQVNLMMRVYPPSYAKQFEGDPDWAAMPYLGTLGEIVPALLLSHWLLKPDGWGVQPIPVAVGAFGTGSFTPERLIYRDLFDGPAGGSGTAKAFDIPLEQSPGVPTDQRQVVSYCLDSERFPITFGRPWGLWLVVDQPVREGWKMSYCVGHMSDHPSARWDLDPNHPEWDAVPDFEPLAWPPPQDIEPI